MIKLRKISRGFQITLPQQFREDHGLEIGDFVEVIEEKDHIILKAFQSDRAENPVDKILKLLQNSNPTEAFELYESEDAFLQSFQSLEKKTG